MGFLIKKMNRDYKSSVIAMMRDFYNSEAVFTNGSDEIFEQDFENCINECPYLEGFVFCKEAEILGYAMIAKSFSTEFGKPCIWFEDLYLKPEFRGQHIIPEFIKHIENTYSQCIFRLEVEKDNNHAVHVYNKLDFQELPYIEMKKD